MPCVIPLRLIYSRAGTDLRTIQELLGHEDITTTEIYLHVAVGVNGMGVVSPLNGVGVGVGVC